MSATVREDGAFVGSAMVALGGLERIALHAFIGRHGTTSGSWVTLPVGAQVYAEWTERSVRGHLREAIIRDLRSVSGRPPDHQYHTSQAGLVVGLACTS